MKHLATNDPRCTHIALHSVVWRLEVGNPAVDDGDDLRLAILHVLPLLTVRQPE